MAEVRRNFILGIGHESLWGAAMGLVNPFTMLPLAAHALGRSVEDAGLMEAALFAGASAPQLIGAFAIGPRFSEPMACAKLHIFCLVGTALAFLALVWPGLDPDRRWSLFLGSFVLHWTATGFVVPSWASLSSRNVPPEKLGRYFGISFAGAGAASTLTGILGAWLAAKGGLAWGYPVCIALALCFQILSVTLLSQTRPLTPPHDDPGRLGPFLRECWRKLGHDRPFRSFVLLVVLMQFVGAATMLFTASLKDQGLADSAFQWLNPAMALGGMAGSYWLGHLFDHTGATRPWLLAFGALLVSLTALVWGGGHLTALVLTYAGGGLYFAVYGAVNLPWMLRLAGTAQTAAFTGLINTLTAPLVFLAPFLLGKLARHHGANAAYAVAALATAASVALILGSSSLRQEARA